MVLRTIVSDVVPGSGPLDAAAQLIVAGGAGSIVILRAQRRMRVRELDPVLARLPGVSRLLGTTTPP